jgi:hypothetical protein
VATEPLCIFHKVIELLFLQTLRQLYPKELQGHLAQSLNVLAMFINGILVSKRTHTRQTAKKMPVTAKVTSRENSSAVGAKMSASPTNCTYCRLSKPCSRPWPSTR